MPGESRCELYAADLHDLHAQSSTDGDTSVRPGARVLTLAAGGGVLPLLAAAAGAAHVTAVERSRMLYRMARQVGNPAHAAPQLLSA